MRYLSLFSGIGGFELGIQQAYEDFSSGEEIKRDNGEGVLKPWDSTDNLRTRNGRESHLCIGYSEIDKYAIKIYERHFPGHRNYGDITKINASLLHNFDFLCGGFPCQSFSIAGKRGGFADTRGTLFFDIARILQAKQPTRFLLENVKGLLSHDNGFTFKTIISTLDELGYDLQWQVLNSKNHGVPQNRERVFIVGHLRGTPRPEVFPLCGSNNPIGQEYAGSIGTPRLPKQMHLSRAHKQPARVYRQSGYQSNTLKWGNARQVQHHRRQTGCTARREYRQR